MQLTYEQVRERFRPNLWDSLDEYEKYYLTDLAEKGNTIHYTDRDGVEKTIPAVNHHPNLYEYEVWMEGYAATGESAGAHLLGKVHARNFAQACHIISCQDYLKWASKVNDPTYKQYENASRWDYDPNKLSHWACGLYWDEKIARKSFG